jgi:uncharacterized cofD-like protein
LTSEVVVLGGGRGLASVLRALRDEDVSVTAIVGLAEDALPGADPGLQVSGPGVEDLRRSLEALTSEEGALLRAIRRPLSVGPVGRHPLGNLVLASVASAFGDYGRASTWLGEQLGTSGAVIPATKEPVGVQTAPVVASAGATERRLRRVRFAGGAVESPDAAINAIQRAQWAVLAPGSLYRSLISTAAVPDLASALSSTAARVLWIANLAPDPLDAPGTVAIDHLLALRLHGIRVDAAMHDPAAAFPLDSAELRRYGVEPLAGTLRSTDDPAVHDVDGLRRALIEQIRSTSTSTVGEISRRR